MRLLYISNARIPTEKAHGIQIMKMCEAFASRGNVEVELVVPERFNEIKKDTFRYYGIKENFKIKRLCCWDLIRWDRYIWYLGLWIESITFVISVFRYLRSQKADIIYTRDKFLLPLCFFKENLIFETHTFPKNYFLYSPFLKRLKRIVVITQKLKELLVWKGLNPDRILVAPDGVDLGQFNIGETREHWRKVWLPNIPLDKKIVLYAGHLYGWKGAATLLKVADKFPNLQFVFVGGTKKDIADFKKQAGNLTNVFIVGHYPHRKIPQWLKMADVLALPNSGKAEISKYWTSPLKMFEYMASKRPIVASNLPSIREILNEENSVLVKPDDPRELAEGIRRVLDNPALAEKISLQAFNDVQNYTWQKRAERILNFIKNDGK